MSENKLDAFRWPEDCSQELKAIARKSNMNFSTLARMILIDWLQKYKAGEVEIVNGIKEPA